MDYNSDFKSWCKNLLENIGKILLVLIGIHSEKRWDRNDGFYFRSRIKYLAKIGGLVTNSFPNLVFQYVINYCWSGRLRALIL